jgi:hypothetical protein
MGLVALVQSYTAELAAGVHSALVKAVVSGRNILTVQHFGPPGDDSQPLAGDFVSLKETSGAGAYDAVGYHDPKNQPKAAPGERRSYARDPVTGAVVSEVWQKNTGEVVIEILKEGGAPLRIKTRGPVIVESPDIRLGDEPGRPIVRLGDIVQVVIHAICGPPGTPLQAKPPATPTATGGVVAVGQIISSCQSVKAGP